MPTGKDIVDKQNELEQLRLLAAQRELYSSEKKALGWQMLIAVAVALGGSFVQTTYPAFAPYVVILGAAVALADVIWFESKKGKCQRLAAKVQEKFDCIVLRMDWRDLKAGSEPDPEDILDHSEKVISNQQLKDKLIDWYPKEIQELPLQPARIVCQRENCLYDSRLRDKYILGLKVGLGAVTIVAFIIAIVQNKDFVQSIALIVAPLIPAYVIALREIYAHSEAIDLAQRLKDHSNGLWTKALSKTLTSAELDAESRLLQDEIYDNRRRSPVIFNWVYDLLRDKNEKTLNASAQQLVNEYKAQNP